MPRHQQVTVCRKNGGPLSELCTCEHCNLSVCGVCGAFEGGLTTDCPGTAVDFDRQREVYETPLDYTDARGWHQGEPMARRVPHFATTRLPPTPPRVDPRTLVAPSVDWGMIDRCAALQQALAHHAIAWVLADRDCADLSAALLRVEDDVNSHVSNAEDPGSDLLVRLEVVRREFQQACQLVEERDDEFRQAARQLTDAMEPHPDEDPDEDPIEQIPRD